MISRDGTIDTQADDMPDSIQHLWDKIGENSISQHNMMLQSMEFIENDRVVFQTDGEEVCKESMLTEGHPAQWTTCVWFCSNTQGEFDLQKLADFNLVMDIFNKRCIEDPLTENIVFRLRRMSKQEVKEWRKQQTIRPKNVVSLRNTVHQNFYMTHKKVTYIS